MTFTFTSVAVVAAIDIEGNVVGMVTGSKSILIEQLKRLFTQVK